MAELIELTCPNCGGKLERVGDADQFVCPHCGAEPLVTTEQGAMAPTPVAERLRCPECDMFDLVQKVSSIHRAGLSRGSYTGHTWKTDDFVYVSGHSQTELSRLLSPPKEPSPTAWGGILVFVFGSLSLVSMSLLFICVVPYHIFVTFTRFSPGQLLGTIALIAVGILIGLVYGYLPFRAGKRAIASKRRQFPTEKARWERAMRRWEHLYYCARDDGVFMPGETSLTPIDQVQTYLYAD